MHSVCEIVISPLSPFGTPLAGDTLFGHLAWQLAYDDSLLKMPFTEAIEQYLRVPFAVVSSALPRVVCDGRRGYAVKRPELALFTDLLAQNTVSRRRIMEARKESKKRKWLFVERGLKVHFSEKYLMSESDVASGVALAREDPGKKKVYGATENQYLLTVERAHNSINRLTSTTGEGFAPYSEEIISYLPGTRLSVFVLTNPDVLQLDSLAEAFSRIGSFGYGRDASSGLGRFAVIDLVERDFPSAEGSNSCYTLAPCLPVQDEMERSWMQPVTRFGKHGGGAQLLGNPFKNPVVLADDGAVFEVEPYSEGKRYIGCGLNGVSKAVPGTVVQGFSPVLPCNVEV